MLNHFIEFLVILGQLGWAAGTVVLIFKVPGAVRNWIIAKADREREISLALKQLRPNGGTSLADKVVRIESKLDEHIEASKIESTLLHTHIDTAAISEAAAVVERERQGGV